MAEAAVLDPAPKVDVPTVAKAPSPDRSLTGALGLGGNQDTLAADRATIGLLEDRALRAPRLTPPPPQAAVTDPLQAFGQPAMWLAAFGSLLTRRPLANAINAAGKVMEATHGLDQEAAKTAYTTWKTESENALKLAKYEQDAYKAAVQKYRVDAQAGEAELRTTAAAFKNAALQQVYQQEGMPGVIKYTLAGGKNLERAGEAQKKFDIQHQDQLAVRTIADARILERETGLGRALAPEERAQVLLDVGNEQTAKKAGTRSAAVAEAKPQSSLAQERKTRFDEAKQEMQANGTYTNDSGVWGKVNHDMFTSKSASFQPGVAEMVADQIIAGNTQAASGFGRSPQLLAQLDNALLKRMAEHDPPLTGADLARIKVEYGAYSQGTKAFEAGGKLEPVVRSLNVTTSHLGTLEAAADALAKNDVRALNAMQNRIATELGYSGPLTFDAVKIVVGQEIEKAVAGSAGALEDRREIRDSLNRASSPEQLAKVIRAYEDLMGGQIGGMRQTYDRVQRLGGGETGKFDERFLSPDTRRIILGEKPKTEGTAPKGERPPQPAKYPDATWDEGRGAYVVTRDGKKFQVKQ